MIKKMPWYSLIVTLVYILGAAIGAYSASKLNMELTPDPQKLNYDTVILHNLNVVLLMAAGIVTLGIGTLSIIFINGSSLGITLGAFADKHYFGDIVMALVPHGIFEIPAFIIAAAGDLYICVAIILLIMRRKENAKTKFKRGVMFNVAAAALIIVAGIVEVSMPVPTISQ
ncbi:stage II sporulation protein M [Ectobacillus sp. JY-23]|uniref:stage II sporulation protein M n=1 Tax=Ectobacillus sp. JY-23 TaxID=2933872 RepID=UPI001FF56402|nr:stage II sporulation protein M [Ectobacillus sp. JY-23]UOY91141.1 stage II sporulation protein M [Ectobacillus sp. JY-23]